MAATTRRGREWSNTNPVQSGNAPERRLLSGVLHATTAVVWIDPAIIRGWLPPGVRFPEACRNPHPLMIIWGTQHDVTAFPGGGRIPLPWRLGYSEIITAVPDLRIDPSPRINYDGPVTYLPRLYMNSWRAALLGRAVYGFSKAYASIDDTGDCFRALDRRGRPMLTAGIESRSTPCTVDSEHPGLLEQPLALVASGRLILGRFETTLLDETLTPVSVDIEVQPPLLSYLPGIRRFISGIDSEPDGAYQFMAEWSLARIV